MGELTVLSRRAEDGAAPRDTIFALSSGLPPAGVAIVRMSGPGARAALAVMCGSVPAPRLATLMDVREPGTGERLDRALVLSFPAPASFTGEDVAELHLHGGRAVVGGVLRALGTLPGLRLAEPGEFTRRAFERGRIDLTEAEGLADLVAAETAAQRRQALDQAGGSIRERYDRWSERLTDIRAGLEAEIEFSEEDATAGFWAERGRQATVQLRDEILAALRRSAGAEKIREGFVAVILGPPNAGKSTLLNALAGREVAIVTAEPGTTRDLIEVPLDLGGLPVTLVDTAGLRELATSAVEREGIRRAQARAAGADLLIALGDGSGAGGQAAADPQRVLRVAAKADLLDQAARARLGGQVDLIVSAWTGEGLDQLAAAIGERIRARAALPEAPVVTRERHRHALEACAAELDGAGRASEAEVVSEHLRLAARSLERLAGRVDVEDVLGSIFAQFCIGK